eukprot:m.121573 g.121573  ORF g.121573 m.121573 type:complete len:124 (-) comp28864_c0_seq2:607-978(-)
MRAVPLSLSLSDIEKHIPLSLPSEVLLFCWVVHTYIVRTTGFVAAQPPHTHTFTQSFSLAHTHTQTPIHTLSLSLSFLTLTRSPSHTLPLPLPLPHPTPPSVFRGIENFFSRRIRRNLNIGVF